MTKKRASDPSSVAPAIQHEFRAGAEHDFYSFVGQADFPCLGAKAAINAESVVLRVYDELGSDTSARGLAADLRAFVDSELRITSEYSTFVAIFLNPLGEDEAGFEERLWLQLGRLNQIDAQKGYHWDSAVKSDPGDPHFSFSFAGEALYVIGMHGNSSRAARRFKWPTLVFNPHEQFAQLRAGGKWKRLQAAIRARDLDLQGSINPMLSDFGEKSEARQYSGRTVAETWQPPFSAAEPDHSQQAVAPRRCPFAH